jgi:maltose O-acetyltransferase
MFKRIAKNILRRLIREMDFIRNDTREIPFRSRGIGVRISCGCKFVESQNIDIGDYVYIGPYCLFGGVGGLKIGSNVAIGPHVYIYTNNHNYNDADFIPFDEKNDFRPVTIESHVWIGGNVVILPGVTVNEGAIIGAGSVVTKDVPRCAVVGGNPARVIKYRNIERFDTLVTEGKWYERYEWESRNFDKG